MPPAVVLSAPCILDKNCGCGVSCNSLCLSRRRWEGLMRR